MSAVISATAFRANIFQFLDQSYTKKKPLRIKRKHQVFRLIPEEAFQEEVVPKKKFRFADLPGGNPDVINGPDDLDTFVTPTEWNEPSII